MKNRTMIGILCMVLVVADDVSHFINAIGQARRGFTSPGLTINTI